MDNQPEGKNLSVEDVHFEKGWIVPDNRRLINQSHLSAVAQDFIPQLVVPDTEILEQADAENAFPVEKIQGPQWQQLIISPHETKWFGQEIAPFAFNDHLQIARQSIREAKFLFDTYGIILTDRNPTNIVLKPVDQQGHINAGGKDWKVYQVDFGTVYDAVNGTLYIDNAVNLLERQGVPKIYKNSKVTNHNVADSIMSTISTIQKMNTDPYFSTLMSSETRRLMTDFSDQWNVRGVSETSHESIDFNKALNYLDSLMRAQEDFSEFNTPTQSRATDISLGRSFLQRILRFGKKK